jgi:uncharacterized membrane protein YdjX (TVP38/TMEM64 family)
MTRRFVLSPGQWAVLGGLLLVAGLLLALWASPWGAGLHDMMALRPVAVLQAHRAWLQTLVSELGWRAPALFAVVYVTLTGLILPVNVPLSLVAGALFGLWPGVALTSLCTATGATLSCLSSRTLLRGFVHRRLHGRLAEVEAGLEREGSLYLLSLRLMPLVPYTMVNLIFGLTTMPLWRIFALTWLGTLPATIAFVNAGTELENLDSAGSVLGLRLMVSLTLLGCVPLAAARLRRALLRRLTL